MRFVVVLVGLLVTACTPAAPIRVPETATDRVCVRDCQIVSTFCASRCGSLGLLMQSGCHRTCNVNLEGCYSTCD